MQAASKTAVVILNWNGKDFLARFLPGLISGTPSGTRIIIADNGSSDDSVRFVQENFPAAGIIRLGKNYGFSGGYNEALLKVEAEYFLLLNSDVEVTPGWLEPLEELMDTDKKIAACQPKIRSLSEREKFEYAGAAGGFIDSYGYPFCRGRIFSSVEEDHGQYDDETEILWASGACMMVRAEYFKAAGGFDGDFFAHMEEIDLCWRFRNMGYRVLYCPHSMVFHLGGGTLPRKNPRKTYLNFRNNLVMLFKNLPSSRMIPVFVLRFIFDGIAGLKFLLTDHYLDCFAVLRAHFYFYFHLPRLLKKRRACRKSLPRHGKNPMFGGNIVLEYFVMGKKRFSDIAPGK